MVENVATRQGAESAKRSWRIAKYPAPVLGLNLQCQPVGLLAGICVSTVCNLDGLGPSSVHVLRKSCTPTARYPSN